MNDRSSSLKAGKERHAHMPYVLFHLRTCSTVFLPNLLQLPCLLKRFESSMGQRIEYFFFFFCCSFFFTSFPPQSLKLANSGMPWESAWWVYVSFYSYGIPVMWLMNSTRCQIFHLSSIASSHPYLPRTGQVKWEVHLTIFIISQT